MKTKITREKELEIMLAIAVALLLVFFITKPQGAYLLYLAIATSLTALFSKPLSSKIAWGWLKLGEIFGSVISKILLTVLYFCFLWPVAVLAKMFGRKNNLQLNKNESDSYFVTRNHKYEAGDLEKMW